MKKVLIITVLLCGAQLLSQEANFNFEGLKIFVDDLSTAKTFYSNSLGFDLEESSDKVVLVNESFPIFLVEGKGGHDMVFPKFSRTGLTVYVDKLLPKIDELRKWNIKVHDTLLERNGVGIAIPFEDITGNVIGLMEVQIRDLPMFDGLKVYNCGVTISDMDEALGFYKGILGFQEWSMDYLPQAMPLRNTDGSFGFMVHFEKNLLDRTGSYGDLPGMSLIFTSSDMERALVYLRGSGIEVERKDDFLIFQDPFGNWLEIHQQSATD